MSDVFISYSRKDAAFVRNLHDALKVVGRESWVDWEGIPPSAEWMAEIQRAIAAADTFVFVVSHHSAASTVCRAEAEFAAEQGKRIVPVACAEPETATVPDAVARLNWIFFRPEDPFSERFATLDVGDPVWHWQDYIDISTQMQDEFRDFISEYNKNRKVTVGLNDITIIAQAAALLVPLLSMESRVGNAKARRRIPDVCDKVGVKHIYFNDLLRADNIKL